MRFRLLVIYLLFSTCSLTIWAGVGSKDTVYVRGPINWIKQDTEGKSSATDERVFAFLYKGGQLTIPSDRVNTLEYGQKAGRRVGVAIMVSPIALLSKNVAAPRALSHPARSEFKPSV